MDFELNEELQRSEHKLVEKYNTELRKDSKIHNYIQIEFPKIEEKYKFYSRMFTFVHNPEYISIEKAWGWLFFDIQKIKKIISDKNNNILFAVLGIETHMGKKNEESLLKGYPHIHLVVYRKSQAKLESFNDLHSQLRETTFGKTGEDIQIDGESPKKKRTLAKSNISFFRYVLKNTKHSETHEKIKDAYERYIDRLENIKDLTLDVCYLIDNSDDKEIIDFFNELNKRNVIIHIPKEKLKITGMKKVGIIGFHGKNGTRKATVAQEDLVNSSVYVLENMEKMGLKLCNNKVYVRKENTRRTWKHWGSLERLIGKLTTLEDPIMYCLLSKNSDTILKNATREKQTIFPVIEIDWFYIEFEDFFLHIPSCEIYKEIPENIACGLHNPGITLERLLTEDLKPYVWLSIINNQKFSQDLESLEKFKTIYFSTLLPLIQKALVLCLQGVANSGKTTLLEPIRRLFPKEVQTEITKGQFTYSGLPGKRLLALDDVKPEVLSSGNFKQLLEGGFKPMTMESKNVNAVMDIFGGNVLISANMDGLPNSWYEFSKELDDFVLKTEFQVRLAIYRFETTINKPQPGFLQKMQYEEIGKVMLECGKSYARTMLGREYGNEYKIMKSFEAGIKSREDAERIYRPIEG